MTDMLRECQLHEQERQELADLGIDLSDKVVVNTENEDNALEIEQKTRQWLAT